MDMDNSFSLCRKGCVFVIFLLKPSNYKYIFKYIFCILAPTKKKLPWDFPHSTTGFYYIQGVIVAKQCNKAVCLYETLSYSTRKRIIIFFPSLALVGKLIAIRPMLMIFISCSDTGCSELWQSFHLSGDPHNLTIWPGQLAVSSEISLLWTFQRLFLNPVVLRFFSWQPARHWNNGCSFPSYLEKLKKNLVW